MVKIAHLENKTIVVHIFNNYFIIYYLLSLLINMFLIFYFILKCI